VSEGAGSDALARRIDIYLSGGGYRAALGALGVMYFLAFDGRWADVRRIVSVSGGSIVNAHLALSRPATADVPDELTSLFRTLTSRRQSNRARLPAVIAFVVGTVPVVALVWDLSDSVKVLAAAIWLPIALFYAVRLWLWLLYRGIVGAAYLDDLANREWTIEHVLVASDLSKHGSVFFLVNAIQAQVASLTRGCFDARDVTFRKALRATTALPPVLPPTRLILKSKPGRRDSRLAAREYLWRPEHEHDPHAQRAKPLKAWLADGGVTGNLGIQLDATLAPDNPTLLDLVSLSTMTGTPLARNQYTCRWHDNQIAWNCLECRHDTVVVDASGLSPPTSRLFETMLGIPPLGVGFFAVRSLQVMYESSLLDDQALAGDLLIGVVRADQMIQRIAMKSVLVGSTNPAHRAFEVGQFLQLSKNVAEPAFQQPAGMSDLMRACYTARTAASKVTTRLRAVSAPAAAQVVASGYLNTCLNTHGPDAFETADQGIRRLAKLLGPDAALDDWWDGVLGEISAND
jgi:predicted acylesterase/phospholipase RssA